MEWIETCGWMRAIYVIHAEGSPFLAADRQLAEAASVVPDPRDGPKMPPSITVMEGAERDFAIVDLLGSSAGRSVTIE
jgi:hypothetical protein